MGRKITHFFGSHAVVSTMEARAVSREAPVVRTGWSRWTVRAATDAGLVALVRQGRPAAFEAIRDRYSQPILRSVVACSATRRKPADAVEHTFTVAYTAITSTDKPVVLRLVVVYESPATVATRCANSGAKQPGRELVEPGTIGLASQIQRPVGLRQLLVQDCGIPTTSERRSCLASWVALAMPEIGTALGLPPRR